MIVWLASYPRSGNRLLRRILYETMGLKSHSDRKLKFQLNAVDGGLLRGQPYDEINYDEASRSDQIFLVKTHHLPRDGQPTLYIVRDGRKSCLSYQYFHQCKTPAPFPTLLDVVLGNDLFGSWSTHYRIWAAHGNLMLLRYEDLVAASEDLLREIACFIGYTGSVRPWVNDFDDEQRKAPGLVREGRVSWDNNDPLWSSMIDAVFFQLHGDLMVELGYVNAETRAQHCASIPHGWNELIDAACTYLGECNAARKICDERYTVIEELKNACDERLELIKKLSR